VIWEQRNEYALEIAKQAAPQQIPLFHRPNPCRKPTYQCMMLVGPVGTSRWNSGMAALADETLKAIIALI
jgi:hypothetical protein